MTSGGSTAQIHTQRQIPATKSREGQEYAHARSEVDTRKTLKSVLIASAKKHG